MFDYMANYAAILRRMYETPMLATSGANAPDIQKASEIIQHVRDTGRTILTEFESKQLLAAYRIPTVATHIALSEEEAVTLANEVGYPVVLKLHSETITHKTDVGGVQLNLADSEAVQKAFHLIQDTLHERVGEKDENGTPHFMGVTVQPMVNLDGYELILGSSLDPQFGPVLLFGMGGSLVEVFKDSALGLPPLNTTLARRMMERTKIYTALKGVRGRKPVDMEALEQLLVRFSQLISEQVWVKELDINPLLVDEDRLLALDARVVLHEPGITEDRLPRLAIRPYPAQYTWDFAAKDGSHITIRPIRAEDEPEMVEFHETLSDRSVYMRYMHPMLLTNRVAHERLSRICHGDYDREITLVADKESAAPGELRLLGASRMSKLHGVNGARFSILVSDQTQGLGVGQELMRRLIDVARGEKFEIMEAIMTEDNLAMQTMVKRNGFSVEPAGDGLLRATLKLN
jgi:acetyltransferase